MLVGLQREVLEPRHGARELVDRVLAQVRHRAVGGLAARDRVGPHDALVRHARVVRRRLGDQHGAAAAERAVACVSASAPSQPVSSPAHSTSSSPAAPSPSAATRSAATTIAAVPPFMSLVPRP